MALKTRKVTNVSEQRKAVQALIANAQGADAALAAAEHALSTLDNALVTYSK